LFESTVGNSSLWLNAQNWLSTSASICTWFGVTCYPDSCQVQLLNLFQNGLSGTIPVEIGRFSAILSIVLTQNSLIGTLPDSLNSFIYLLNGITFFPASE
jgi:hypothetical protein